MAAETAPQVVPAPAVATHALDDSKLEPWLASPAPAEPAAYRERLPLQVPAWMHKRQGRRRRTNMALTMTVGSRSTILLLFLLVLALLVWPMPQPGASAAASTQGGAVKERSAFRPSR